MRIVLVEDNQMLAQGIQKVLLDEGHSVDYFIDGSFADRHLEHEGADLAIIDINLPGMDGISLTKNIRKRSQIFPIIILTARGATRDRVIGLDAGADDYLTKPFHREELIARIHAIIRRSKGHSQSIIKTGDIEVNLDGKTVEVRGNTVHLTGKEYQILELLSLRKGTTLTKEMFLNHLYGGMDEPELKIIDVFICKLRKKLSEATGRGYVLRDPKPDDAAQDMAISA